MSLPLLHKGIFLQHLSWYKQNNKYIHNKIAGVKNADISNGDRETINNEQQTENNCSFKIKENNATEVESKTTIEMLKKI